VPTTTTVRIALRRRATSRKLRNLIERTIS
jgi:hypothetical protein